MNRRAVLGLGALVVVIAVLVLLGGAGTRGEQPGHPSTSDTGTGTSALRFYAESLGHRTGAIEGDFSLPSSPAMLFVFTPVQGYGYSLDQANQLQTWVSSGGVLVYAAEDPDPVLDQTFNLSHAPAEPTRTISQPAPILGGVQHLSGAARALVLNPGAGQVVLFRNAGGRAVAISQAVGQGRLIALTDPLLLANGYLTLADNGRFAADVLGMAPSGGPVLFDEYHHGAVASSMPPETAWMSTPWGAALLWAVLVLFVGLALRGRPFGPRLGLAPARERSSAEYASAVGSLLHRTGARNVTLETLFGAARRAVSERVGLSRETPTHQLNEVVAQRAPAAGKDLIDAERGLSQAALSEAGVLAMARRLHDLAYPLAAKEDRKETQ